MAAYYSEQLSQNIKRGQRASAAKAQSIGGNRPLGYLTGSNKKFIIDPKTAPTVKLVFDLYAKGQTIAQIVRHLNAQGRRTLKGKQKRLIKLFVNSIFVYDDKIVLTFNYSGDNRTITLKEIDAGLRRSFNCPAH